MQNIGKEIQHSQNLHIVRFAYQIQTFGRLVLCAHAIAHNYQSIDLILPSLCYDSC